MDKVDNQPIASEPCCKDDRWFKTAVVILGILIVLGLFGNIYFLLRKEKQRPAAQITPTPVPTAFKFIETSPSLTPTFKSAKPKLLDTTGWQEIIYKDISFKISPDAEFLAGVISSKKEPGIPLVYISSEEYGGGSRRQWFIDKYGFNSEEAQKLIFEEVLLGKINALNIFNEYLKGTHEPSMFKRNPILISKGNIIVEITSNRHIDLKTGIVTKGEIPHTIASTVKFSP